MPHFTEEVVSTQKALWVQFYRPQTKLREGNVFTRVCLSTIAIGLYFHNDTEQADPHPDTVNRRAVRILQECIRVFLNVCKNKRL